ncbi:MAG: hypothetical protein ACI4JZ_04675 [Oscillospiraceae bacterium]
MEKLKYAGLCAAGFLTELASCAAVLAVWIYFVSYEFRFVLYLAALAIPAIFGFAHLAFRRIIRKMHGSTRAYSIIAQLLPIVLGVCWFIVTCVFNQNGSWLSGLENVRKIIFSLIFIGASFFTAAWDWIYHNIFFKRT